MYRQKRDKVDEGSKQAADAAILTQLYELDEYLAAKEIFVYVSYGSEADTRGIIADAFKRKKRVAVPKIVGKAEMQFLWIDGFSDLKPNKLGILEPVCVNAALPPNGALFIVPGLVFSEGMDRVGYGGGFYDAYLTGLDVVKVGLCYEFQVVKRLLCEPHDVKMNYIITDKNRLM